MFRLTTSVAYSSASADCAVCGLGRCGTIAACSGVRACIGMRPILRSGTRETGILGIALCHIHCNFESAMDQLVTLTSARGMCTPDDHQTLGERCNQGRPPGYLLRSLRRVNVRERLAELTDVDGVQLAQKPTG